MGILGIFPLPQEIMRLCPNLMLPGIARFVSTQIFFVKWASPADWDRPASGGPLAHPPFHWRISLDVDINMN